MTKDTEKIKLPSDFVETVGDLLATEPEKDEEEREKEGSNPTSSSQAADSEGSE